MTTQVHAAPGETRSEMSEGRPGRGGFSDQSEVRRLLTATTPALVDPVCAEASRLLLLALDDFDSLLADAPALPDPDHEGWRAALYPWIEDLARARKQVEEALVSLGVEHIGARGESYDPACHEVVATEKSGADLATQDVIRVVRPGFRLGPYVLRRARVVVTGLPADPAGGARVLAADQGS
jgi:molecular chaperone GrpE (heat shock protein)